MRERDMQSLEKFINTPIAHRGLHDDKLEENSMSAFEAAIAHGFAIETDVHLLKDGVLAVFHDGNLKRICGKNVKIESLTSAQLKDYPMTRGGEIIPTFPEMLKLVAGRVPLLIELKTLRGVIDNSLAKAVLRDLKAYPYENVIALQSFDFFAVKWLRRHQDTYPYGQLAGWEGEKGKTPKLLNDFMGKLHCAKISKPMFVSYDIISTPNDYLKRCIDSGMPVFSWTVNSEEKLALARKTTTNIIFEGLRPEQVLERREDAAVAVRDDRVSVVEVKKEPAAVVPVKEEPAAVLQVKEEPAEEKKAAPAAEKKAAPAAEKKAAPAEKKAAPAKKPAAPAAEKKTAPAAEKKAAPAAEKKAAPAEKKAAPAAEKKAAPAKKPAAAEKKAPAEKKQPADK